MPVVQDMDISDIRRLNILWSEVYPYLAQQVNSILPESGRVFLEVGPFSGGISFELVKSRQASSMVIADSREEILAYLKDEARRRKLLSQIRLIRSDLPALQFRKAEFDGVICRGAFFFLDELMLQEIHRVLRAGGVGFVGGGFGGLTPRRLIDEIAVESRRLNKGLGKKWMSRTYLEEMIARAGLEKDSRISEEGGLWLILQK